MDHAAHPPTATDAQSVWDANPHLALCHADFGAFKQAHALHIHEAKLDSADAGSRLASQIESLRASAMARVTQIHQPGSALAPIATERRGNRLVVWLYGPMEYGDGRIDGICHSLEANRDAQAIVLRIASAGGRADVATRLANMLLDHPARVVAIIDRFAYSAASLVASSAHRVLIRRSAAWMAHASHVTHSGDADSMQQRAIELRYIDRRMAAIYAGPRRRANASDVHQLITNSTYLSAEQAVAVGVCDDIVSDLPLNWSHDTQ